MNKLHHPHSRAERLAIKAKKDKLSAKGKGRPSVKKTREEAIEREADDELRGYISQAEVYTGKEEGQLP